VNKATYAAMSDAQKQVIDDHCTTDWAVRFADPWVDYEHDGLEKIRAEPEHEVYKISDEQLTEWKTSAEPLKLKWAAGVKNTGGDPDTIWKELQDSLTRYSAGF